MTTDAANEAADDAELRRAGVTAIVALGILQIADVVITQTVISRGGIELNPLADVLLSSNLALVVKLGIVVALAAHFLRRPPHVITLCALWLVVGIYIFVVAINTSQLVSTM